MCSATDTGSTIIKSFLSGILCPMQKSGREVFPPEKKCYNKCSLFPEYVFLQEPDRSCLPDSSCPENKKRQEV
ncbi:MAG TPA: hypothetical protein DEP61_00475 [Lachnospiraceae bacterium]|nr:hypothetical protein [Lachnospiraceae bacterium]